MSKKQSKPQKTTYKLYIFRPDGTADIRSTGKTKILKQLQEAVGGFVQNAGYVSDYFGSAVGWKKHFTDDAVILVNEIGRCLELKPNKCFPEFVGNVAVISREALN